MNKMYKLPIDDYKVKVKQGDKDRELTYDVIGSFDILLFHQDLRLNGKEVLQNGELQNKLEDCKKREESFVFLTPEEYARLSRLLDLRVFTKNDIELVKRIQNCEEVDVNITEKEGSEKHK